MRDGSSSATDSTTLYLSLGSNVGDRELHLEAARGHLRALPWLAIGRASRVYETAPWGKTDQPSFLNQVIEAVTSASPHDVLAACKHIERDMGRTPGPRWGPRVIDIDLLLFGETVIDAPDLKVPHPLLEQRQFVLVPLAEIAPGLRLPSGRVAAEAALPGDPSVRPFSECARRGPLSGAEAT